MQHCKIRKKTQTRTKKDKLKNTITLFLEKAKQPLAIYRYQLLSSSVYLQLATETFNYTIIGIWQELTINKGKKKLHQFLQENGVTALQTIC